MDRGFLMSEVRRERRRWVAIIAATALVLQALFLGLGAGNAAAAPAPLLDAFGGVICTFDGAAGHGTPERPASHHSGIDCLAHCALMAHAAVSPEAAPRLAGPTAWPIGVSVATRTTALAAPQSDSHRPRGPPRLA